MGSELPELASQLAHYLLEWLGFGTLVGLLAKAILPGRDPGGALATVLVGVIGSLIGAGSLALMANGFHVSPLSPLGFVVAIVGATLLLVLYRLMGEHLPRGSRNWFWPRTTRPRQRVTVTREE